MKNQQSQLHLCLAVGLALAGRPQLSLAQPTAEEAVRFLEQSTFGPNPALIQHVQDIGFDAFLEEQFNMAPTGWTDYGLCPGDPGAMNNPCNPTGCTTCTRNSYTMYRVQNEFYRRALTATDQLRLRVVFALDQIWVISAQVVDNFQTGWMAYYLNNAIEPNVFGNYRDLMGAITLSPGMGRYLDMAGNNGAAPNENYAREILQLFCVGLDELNDDGTPILDEFQNRIPSYNQDIIVGFAKVFTGWNFAPNVIDPPNCAQTPTNLQCPNWRDQMVLTESRHNHESKTLMIDIRSPDPVVLPANQMGPDDLAQGLDNIFYNHNVPPFIVKQLIQKLVTSNPSQDYVTRVVQVFQDNGSGVRGDFRAVIKAILLDQEARNPPGQNFGKLREPVLAITTLLRSFNTDDPFTDFVLGESFLPSNLRLDEDLFRSPTVFNFYSPFFPLDGGLVGPEFAIQGTANTLGRINLMNALVYIGIPPDSNRPLGTRIPQAEMAAYAQNGPDNLVSSLNTLMLHGAMSDDLRTAVLNAVSGIPDPTQMAQYAVYLIATSSSYQVQR